MERVGVCGPKIWNHTLKNGCLFEPRGLRTKRPSPNGGLGNWDLTWNGGLENWDFNCVGIGTGWSMKKICFGTSGNEKDMLWNGWQGVKRGSYGPHIPILSLYVSAPPPPRGLYIIRVNNFLKSTLNEDEATVPTALWTLHRTCAPGYRSQISYPFRGPVWEICEFDTLFAHFPVFDTLNAIRTLRARWRKRYPFLQIFIDADAVQAPMRHAPPPRMSL